MTSTEVRNTLCRMCDEHCAIQVTLQDGKMTVIEGCESHSWNRGRICGKAPSAITMAYHSERILKPLKKVGDHWQEIDLGQALDEIAEKLSNIRDKFGARGVGVWKGEALGFAQEADLYRRFIHAFGSPNYFSNDSACYVGRYMGYRLGFGVYGIPDYENSRCIVVWGSNPPSSHPNTNHWIMRGKKNGAKLLTVDPRVSTIAKQADFHLSIKPGTDACLALGLARILIETNRYDRAFIAEYCIGFEKFADHVGKFTLEFVERETGIRTSLIEQMADILTEAAPNVAICVGNGTEHQIGGVQGLRAIALLDALLGSFDRQGGNRWVDGVESRDLTLHQEYSLAHLGPIGADAFPVNYDFRQECSAIRLMDTLLSERPYPIKGLILAGANPVLSNPNSQKVREALSKLDLFVVRELFMTKTAELAQYVLPAATFLERSELHCHGAVQRINLTRKVLSIPGVQDEYQFLRELAVRLKMKKYFPWQDEDELNRWILEPTGITTDELLKHIEGIQYKPISYEKWREKKLPTPSGKVEFASQYLKKSGLPELPDYVPPLNTLSDPNNEYPYELISGARKPLYAYNGCYSSNRSAFEPELEISPADAALLGLQTGDPVLVSSETGTVELKVKVVSADGIISGCVVVAQGWQDANVNELTSDHLLDPLDGFPPLKSVPVKIVKR